MTTYRLPLKRGELARLVAEARTPAPLTLVVPMPPNVTNRSRGSTHWRRAWREKTNYCSMLDYIAAYPPNSDGGLAGCELPPPPSVPFAHVLVTSDMVLGGAMDDDNAVARHKWLLDWLVAHGYLASDRRTCVRWAAFPTQRVTRKEPARIHLTLTPTERSA
jgi:hypothetical protein